MTGKTVALFAACYNDTVWPGTPISTVKVLERLGCRVVFPRKQTCCGQIFTNTGYAAEAIPLVRGFVETFASFDYVVAPSGSCVGAVREQHHQLAERSGDSGLIREVEAVVPRVYDISEFLVDVLGVTDVGAYFPHRVTYHPTCHSLRVAHVGDKPLQLLRGVRGITIVDPLTAASFKSAELAVRPFEPAIPYEICVFHRPGLSRLGEAFLEKLDTFLAPHAEDTHA